MMQGNYETKKQLQLLVSMLPLPERHPHQWRWHLAKPNSKTWTDIVLFHSHFSPVLLFQDKGFFYDTSKIVGISNLIHLFTTFLTATKIFAAVTFIFPEIVNTVFQFSTVCWIFPAYGLVSWFLHMHQGVKKSFSSNISLERNTMIYLIPQ